MDIIKYFSGGFPLTIERLQFMQDAQNKAISQLTKLAGAGKLIIEGVEKQENDLLSDGIIIIDGEIIAFEGGIFDSRVAVFESEDDVPYNEDVDQDGNLDQKVADVVRVARCAALGGIDSFDFDDLVRVPNLQTLSPIVGEVKQGLFDLNNLPSGWFPCDGQDGRPDARGRAIIGAGLYSTDNINYLQGDTGGSREVQLSLSQMPLHNHTGSVTIPPHTHSIDQAVKSGGGNSNALTNKDNTGHSKITQTGASSAQTASISTNNRGGNSAHENMMPWLALQTIIYLG